MPCIGAYWRSSKGSKNGCCKDCCMYWCAPFAMLSDCPTLSDFNKNVFENSVAKASAPASGAPPVTNSMEMESLPFLAIVDERV